MFGSPKDVAGECNDRLFLADDYGDNDCTIRCSLSPKHKGLHKESFLWEGKRVTITWEFEKRKEK